MSIWTICNLISWLFVLSLCVFQFYIRSLPVEICLFPTSLVSFFNYLIRSFSGGLLEMCFFSFSASLLFFLSLSGLFQEGLWGGSGRWSSGCSQVNLQKHSDPWKTVIWTVLGKFSVALCSSLRQCTAVGRGYPIPPARIFGETLDILHFFAIVFGFLCDFWITLMHSLIIAPLRGSHGLSDRRAWRTL